MIIRTFMQCNKFDKKKIIVATDNTQIKVCDKIILM